MNEKDTDTGFDLLARVGDGDRELGFWGLVFLLSPIFVVVIRKISPEMSLENILGLKQSLVFNFVVLHLLICLVWIFSLVLILIIGDRYSVASHGMMEPFLRFTLPIFIPFALSPLLKFYFYQKFATSPFWDLQPWWILHFDLIFFLISAALFCVFVFKYREIIFGIPMLIYDSLVGLMKKLFMR